MSLSAAISASEITAPVKITSLISYMIHGHIPNNWDGDYWPLLQKQDSALNARVDINGSEKLRF